MKLFSTLFWLVVLVMTLLWIYAMFAGAYPYPY